MITPQDELLHDVGSDPAWQESFYFNWADPERTSFTLHRDGQGVVEHVWRATPEQTRARRTRFEPISRALRPL